MAGNTEVKDRPEHALLLEKVREQQGPKDVRARGPKPVGGREEVERADETAVYPGAKESVHQATPPNAGRVRAPTVSRILGRRKVCTKPPPAPLTETNVTAAIGARNGTAMLHDAPGGTAVDEASMAGLDPPRLNSDEPVMGSTKEKHRLENKRRHCEQQEQQGPIDYWQHHKGQFSIPTPKQGPATYRNKMCPAGLALHHPAADLLLQYATKGCPTNTGRPWTKAEMEAAIERGPHKSALEPEPMAQQTKEVLEKIATKQAKVVLWDDIKDNPPEQLKISPITMIPHKSRGYRAILDLSFAIRLAMGKVVPSVNETSVKTAPKGAIDQMGHSLMRIIHAFAQADEDTKSSWQNGTSRMALAAGLRGR